MSPTFFFFLQKLNSMNLKIQTNLKDPFHDYQIFDHASSISIHL